MNTMEQIVKNIAGKPVTWSGVVQVERPVSPGPEAPCRVYSARNIEFDGRRAIVVTLPYKAVRHYFNAEDEDVVQVEADLRGGHLQLYNKATFVDWAHFSGRSN